MAIVGRSTVAASYCSPVKAPVVPLVAVHPVDLIVPFVPEPPAAVGLAIVAGLLILCSPAVIPVPVPVALIYPFIYLPVVSLALFPLVELVTGHPEFLQV